MCWVLPGSVETPHTEDARSDVVRRGVSGFLEDIDNHNQSILTDKVLQGFTIKKCTCTYNLTWGQKQTLLRQA